MPCIGETYQPSAISRQPSATPTQLSPRPSGFCREWRGIAVAFAFPLSILQLRIPPITQVVPIAIHGFDQPDFLLPSPRLDLLFAGDPALGVLPTFEINQPALMPRIRHAFDGFRLVLKDSLAKVAGKTNIEVPWRIRQDVHPEPVFALMFHFAKTNGNAPRLRR